MVRKVTYPPRKPYRVPPKKKHGGMVAKTAQARRRRKAKGKG